MHTTTYARTPDLRAIVAACNDTQLRALLTHALLRLLAAAPSGRGAMRGAGSRLTWRTIVVARSCYDMGTRTTLTTTAAAYRRQRTNALVKETDQPGGSPGPPLQPLWGRLRERAGEWSARASFRGVLLSCLR